MKRAFRFIPIMFLLLTFLLGCIHFEPMHSGKIMDAETKQPLSNSVAYIDLSYKCYGYALYSPHVGHDELDSYEVLTDSDGRYQLPSKFNFIPPFLCFTEKYFKFSKVGYFTRTEKSNPGEVYLHRMKYFLNYLPYNDSNKHLLSSDIENKSQYLKAEIKEFNKTKLVPQDEIGVFLRFPGKVITRSYRRSTANNELLYVQDSLSKEWLTFDCNGNKVEMIKDNLPHWDFISTDISWGYPLYASKDVIFYPLDENPISVSRKHAKGETKSVRAKIGNISALFGTYLDFFTFEGNGKAMCNYGNGKDDNLYLRECYTGTDLPILPQDNTIRDSSFEFVDITLNHGMFIVTRTPRYWHIYKYGYTNELKRKFTEIYTLPIEKDITAFTATGNEFFIAFKSDGLKKYDIIGSSAKENTNFSMNSRITRGLTITSLVKGWAVNMSALYATTGDDKIYRFSMDGIPDYLIKR